MSRRNKQKNSSPDRISRLLRKPWLFAGAVFGIDLAMLIIGMVLSGVSGQGVSYAVSGNSIVRDDPLSFYGVIAAVALGINCVLIALILAGATHSKRRSVVIFGAVGLLLVSLLMIAGSAFMALGFPIQSRNYYSYSDDSLRLIAEETKPYFGGGKVSFFLTDSDEEGGAILLAATDISEFADNDERYSIAWQTAELLNIGFPDGGRYRTLTIEVDRTLL